MVSTKTSKLEVQTADSRQVNEVRAASSKFPEIYSILTRNFSKNVLPMSMSCFQVQYCKVTLQNKQVLDKQLSRSLCFNLMHYVQKK